MTFFDASFCSFNYEPWYSVPATGRKMRAESNPQNNDDDVTNREVFPLCFNCTFLQELKCRKKKYCITAVGCWWSCPAERTNRDQALPSRMMTGCRVNKCPRPTFPKIRRCNQKKLYFRHESGGFARESAPLDPAAPPRPSSQPVAAHHDG